MWQDTLSKRYAKAFMNVQADHNQGLAFINEFNLLLEEHKQVKDFLSSPAINLQDKLDLVDIITSEQNNRNFLNLLIAKGRLNLVQRIAKYYLQILEQENGIKNGELYSAYPLNPATLTDVEEIISRKTKNKIHLENIINKDIGIGFKAIVGNHLIDSTLDNKLQKLSSLK